MKQRKLGKSDIAVSEISLGCWTMGGLNWQNGKPNGWANVDEDEVTSAIKKAVDAGVNHFDNADVYGNGRAERMLARCLKRLGLCSEDFVIATKVGHLPGSAEHAYHPHHLRRQCEQSLLNLERDYIDLYYLHHGNFGENDRFLEPSAETLKALQQEGKIRLKGQSAYGVKDFKKAVPVIQPTVLQSWGHILGDNFIRRGSELQKLMDEHELSFVAFSPLAQGLLLDKYDPDNPPNFEEGDNRRNNKTFTDPRKLRDLHKKLSQVKARFGESTEALAGVALRYVLSQPNIACVIPGFRNERQVSCNLSASDMALSEEDVRFIFELFHPGE